MPKAALFVAEMPEITFFTSSGTPMVRLTYSSGGKDFERVFPESQWDAYIEQEHQRLADRRAARGEPVLPMERQHSVRH